MNENITKENEKIDISTTVESLTGETQAGDPKSIMDFALYEPTEENIGNPEYYVVTAGAYVSTISFIGTLVMVELDFGDIGTAILNQLIETIDKFHKEINTRNLLMLSTITPFNPECKYIMVLANPLISLRGYSMDSKDNTILQLVYDIDSVGFNETEIDYKQIKADVDREIHELDTSDISEEALRAAQEAFDDDKNEDDVFKPEFGILSSEERLHEIAGDITRPNKEKDVKVSGQKTTKIDESKTERIKGLRESSKEGDE